MFDTMPWKHQSSISGRSIGFKSRF